MSSDERSYKAEPRADVDGLPICTTKCPAFASPSIIAQTAGLGFCCIARVVVGPLEQAPAAAAGGPGHVPTAAQERQASSCRPALLVLREKAEGRA